MNSIPAALENRAARAAGALVALRTKLHALIEALEPSWARTARRWAFVGSLGGRSSRKQAQKAGPALEPFVNVGL